MNIIVGVAAAAVSRQSCIELAGMACPAFQVIVTGRQRSACSLFVVEAHRVPVENAVATAAVRAETALMHIVAKMTGAAAAVTRITKIRISVTSLAVHIFVTADQTESGHHKMIKSRLTPGRCTVTIGTLVAVSPFVNIVAFVTSDAGAPYLREVVLYMAGITGNAHVSLAQREPGLVVIKLRVRPSTVVMAGRTVVTQLSLVDIVRSMTVDTCRRRVSMCGARRMASTARNGRVRAMQCEVGEPVVETVLIKVNNVHLATFMIGMAACAVDLLRFREAAVKAQLLCDVIADFRMAIDTQLTLKLIREWRMTGIAIRLDVRMTVDDRPWHDQPLLDLRSFCRSLLKKKGQREQSANGKT